MKHVYKLKYSFYNFNVQRKYYIYLHFLFSYNLIYQTKLYLLTYNKVIPTFCF